jgi:hypothetical protein
VVLSIAPANRSDPVPKARSVFRRGAHDRGRVVGVGPDVGARLLDHQEEALRVPRQQPQRRLGHRREARAVLADDRQAERADAEEAEQALPLRRAETRRG